MIQSILTHAMPPWLSHQGRDFDVVISSRVRLARNLADRTFPPRVSRVELASVFSDVTNAFSHPDLGVCFDSVNFEQCDKKQRQFMVEERLASRELAAAQGDRGVIHDATRRVCVAVNEQDHMRLQCLDCGRRPQELWTELDSLDDAVGMRLDYAFDKKRGFLTARPADAGTGLQVSFLVHLPALVFLQSADVVLQAARLRGATIWGFFGGRSTTAGAMFQITMSAPMGSVESEFCAAADAAASSVVAAERRASEQALAAARDELTDKIFKSHEALRGAQRLGMEELLALTSLLRFGIERTLFDKCTIDDLNRLTLFAMPAHLQTYLHKDLRGDELSAARAEMVKTFFTRSVKHRR